MKISEKKLACRHFIKYVGIVAVVAPLSLVILFHTVMHPIIVEDKMILPAIFVLAITAFGAPLLAYIIYDEKKSETYADIVLHLSGFGIMVLVGYIVYHTGGMSHSIFAFFFFFFPSAIAIAFEATIGLAVVCATSFFAVSTNLCLEKVMPPHDQTMYETSKYLILYILFVAIHLTSIYFLETKSIKRNKKKIKRRNK